MGTCRRPDDNSNWRWAFAIIILPAAGALLIGMRSVPTQQLPQERAPLDLAGAALTIAALGSIIVALTYLPQRGMADPIVRATVGLGLASLLAFLILGRGKGQNAILPLAIFSSGSFSAISILNLLLYLVLGGFMVLLPLLFIVELGYSATEAGLALLPLPLVVGTLSRPLGAVATQWGVRRTLTAGPTAVTIGFALLAMLPTSGVNYWLHILPGLVTMSFGMALTVAPLTTAVMNAVENRFVGVASGVNNAISRAAGLIATALLGLVLPNAGGDHTSLMVGFASAVWVGSALAMAAAFTAIAMIKEQDVG